MWAVSARRRLRGIWSYDAGLIESASDFPCFHHSSQHYHPQNIRPQPNQTHLYQHAFIASSQAASNQGQPPFPSKFSNIEWHQSQHNHHFFPTRASQWLMSIRFRFVIILTLASLL